MVSSLTTMLGFTSLFSLALLARCSHGASLLPEAELLLPIRSGLTALEECPAGRFCVKSSEGELLEYPCPAGHFCAAGTGGTCPEEFSPTVVETFTCGEQLGKPKTYSEHRSRIGRTETNLQTISGRIHGVITDGPGNYRDNEDCGWLIRAPTGTSGITLKFIDLHHGSHDYVRVYDGDSESAEMLGECSSRYKNSPYCDWDSLPTLTSTGDSLFIKFSSDWNEFNQRGFKAMFTAPSPCEADAEPCDVATPYAAMQGLSDCGKCPPGRFCARDEELKMHDFACPAGHFCEAGTGGTFNYTKGTPKTFEGGPSKTPQTISGETRGVIWDGAGDYRRNENKGWLIRAPEGMSGITLKFTEFQTFANDWVRVYDGDSESARMIGECSIRPGYRSPKGTTKWLTKWCDWNSLPFTVTSTRGSLFVKFTTDGYNQHKGFKATFEAPPPVEHNAEKCAPGTYNPKEGQTKCAPCPAGSFCETPTEIATCPAGHACLQGSISAKPCETGTFSFKEGSSACSDSCPDGYFCNTAAEKEPCPAGTSSDGKTGLTKFSDCVPCPKGTFNPLEGQTECAATPCPSGHFCATPREKMPCPAGTSSEGRTGLTSQLQCTACASRSFSPDEGLAECADQPCPAGHFCPSGSALPTPCPAGTSSIGRSGKESPEACKPCPVGSYSPEEGQGECAPCPAGSLCLTPKMKQECPEGWTCEKGMVVGNLAKDCVSSGTSDPSVEASFSCSTLTSKKACKKEKKRCKYKNKKCKDKKLGTK